MSALPKSALFYKWLGVGLLVLQQATMPLLTSAARRRSEDRVFIRSANVFLLDIIKLLVCTAVLTVREGSFLRSAHTMVWTHRRDTLKICVPSLIYMLQNNLYYVAMSNLEPTTCCVVYQARILTTALFWRVFMGRPLSARQWMSLFVLVAGVALVQAQYEGPQPASTAVRSTQRPLLGFAAVFTMCFTTAFAGVYMEKVLKGAAVSIWWQNVRLSLFGAVASAVLMFWTDAGTIQRDGFLHGYDALVWLMTLSNSAGGLLVAAVMFYADNILKAYAQSVAVLGAALGSWLLLDFRPGPAFGLGAVAVLGAVLMYNTSGAERSASRRSG